MLDFPRLRTLFAAALAPLSLAGAGLSAEEPILQNVVVSDAVAPILEEGHFPGAAIAVLEDGKPLHVSTHGYASIAHSVPVSSDTVFEIASLTKHMTALAVLDLAREGRLDLTDEVSDFIEDAPSAWSGITIDQLLGHMAGLAHRFEPKFQDEFLLSYTTAEMLASAKAIPLIAPPGTDWSYSDQGYFLLGLVVEKVSGRSFEDHLQERFFEPTGMKQTRFLDQSAIIPELAQGYIFEDEELKRGRRVWQFGLTSHFGVLSSLDDLMRWESALYRGDGQLEVINPQSWKIQRYFSTGDSCREWGYARGWWAMDTGDRKLVYHAGYSGTAYIRDVTNGLSAIVLTNREVSEGQAEPLAIAWAALNAIDPAIPAEGYRCWE